MAGVHRASMDAFLLRLRFRRCDNCFAALSVTGRKCCGGCRSRLYCGVECAQRHWKRAHQEVCSRLHDIESSGACCVVCAAPLARGRRFRNEACGHDVFHRRCFRRVEAIKRSMPPARRPADDSGACPVCDYRRAGRRLAVRKARVVQMVWSIRGRRVDVAVRAETTVGAAALVALERFQKAWPVFSEEFEQRTSWPAGGSAAALARLRRDVAVVDDATGARVKLHRAVGRIVRRTPMLRACFQDRAARGHSTKPQIAGPPPTWEVDDWQRDSDSVKFSRCRGWDPVARLFALERALADDCAGGEPAASDDEFWDPREETYLELYAIEALVVAILKNGRRPPAAANFRPTMTLISLPAALEARFVMWGPGFIASALSFVEETLENFEPAESPFAYLCELFEECGILPKPRRPGGPREAIARLLPLMDHVVLGVDVPLNRLLKRLKSDRPKHSVPSTPRGAFPEALVTHVEAPAQRACILIFNSRSRLYRRLPSLRNHERLLRLPDGPELQDFRRQTEASAETPYRPAQDWPTALAWLGGGNAPS
ncbi:hypothetical protein M885DRAFT_623981 [Pelagophyceae sp. CCMP2097]|nr:hypothetical protein M885DRAFT_623981 [Pelagophyceae sp. CCMP2097]